MSFRDFNKNLSSEIENLFATLGDADLPEEQCRLDESFESVSIQDLLDKIKNVDSSESPE